MGFYRNIILPHLCDLSMRSTLLLPYRERIVGSAEGTVLEIGAGSGLNLPLYGAGVREVLALEPDPRLLEMARRNATQTRRPVTFLDASAEAIPLEDRSVDTVVTTWTLCTIAEASRALQEMHRVLKPAGRLLFVEHGLAPDEGTRKWQNRLTPVWKHVSGGCHLNRPIRIMIERSGFRIEKIDTGYAPGPRFATFMYEGSARPCTRLQAPCGAVPRRDHLLEQRAADLHGFFAFDFSRTQIRQSLELPRILGVGR